MVFITYLVYKAIEPMKPLKFIATVLFLFFVTATFAQQNMEDVLYLKNGTVYRGMIIEQIPNVSYKIQIAGGSVIVVPLPDIEKIAKEPIYHSRAQDHSFDHPFGSGYGMHARDTSTVPYHLRKHRFFSSIEFRPGINNVGLRFLRGFKFNRFAFVGIGFGFDAVSFANGFNDTKHVFDNTRVNNGLYIPVYLHYSGEILRKRVTPYYFLEAGYAAHPVNPFVSNPNHTKSYGGPTASAGFGVKFYSKSRANLAINMNVNWRSDKYRTTINTTDMFGTPYSYVAKGFSQKVFGAVGLAIGF